MRAATAADIPEVLAFWRQAADPTSTDSSEALASLLARDPGALIVAVAAADGKIMGTVVAGWDGWRGSVYRLAVEEQHRRAGLGTELLRAAESRLAELGARRMYAIVVGSSDDALRFWEASDWEYQHGQRRYAKG
jgi:ribosomal protein S18 acetylase RimI-like enzyme